MRQRFFATFTIAAVAPFSDQGGNFAQAVSIRDQSQNPVASNLAVVDESVQALAQYQGNYDSDLLSDQLLAQAGRIPTELTKEFDANLLKAWNKTGPAFAQLMTKKVLTPEQKKKRDTGLGIGFGTLGGVLASGVGVYLLYRNYLSAEAKEAKQQEEYHTYLGESMMDTKKKKDVQDMKDKKKGETKEKIDMILHPEKPSQDDPKEDPEEDPETVEAPASTPEQADTPATTDGSTGPAATPDGPAGPAVASDGSSGNPMNIKVLINQDQSNNQAVGTPVSVPAAPAPTPAAEPEKKKEPEKPEEPKKEEEPKNLSNWEKARSLYDTAKGHYGDAKGIASSDKYAGEKATLKKWGSNLWNKFEDEITLSQTEAEEMKEEHHIMAEVERSAVQEHLGEDLTYGDVAF